jgi:NDP-sugar pyrophosphorylase family protein
MLSKWLLICPSPRPSVARLAETSPLGAATLMGQSLLEYWLSHIACSGGREVLILADDRVEYIRALAGNGSRWGLKITVTEESRELTPAQSLLKYERELGAEGGQNGIVLLDHFPGLQERPLFQSYGGWFKGLVEWLPRARTPDRVGVKEFQPGVWLGSQSHISPSALLHAPCWIGKNTFIGDHAIIGPGAIVEDGVFVEPNTSITESVIGPDTFVGQFSEINDSLAWGDTLIQIASGSVAKITDRFLLCPLRKPWRPESASLFERLTALCTRNKTEAHLLWKHFLMNKEG